MRCVLVSDEFADKSAVAMNVNFGCSMDVVPYLGTAHLLEHMLFLGTKKYPDNRKFLEFVKQNGGKRNGMTGLTDTTYFFDVANDALEEGLDIFAQFFTSPLLTEVAVNGEANVVHQEYNIALNDDGWRRLNMLQKLSHKESNFSRFGTGTNHLARTEGTTKALIEFHKKWYSANQMNLIISG